MYHVSSELAGNKVLNELENLQAILKQDKPSDKWEDEAWNRHVRDEFQNKILALWAVNETIQLLGWIEHTSDWDWWIELRYADGHKRHFDCGSYITGFIDSKGTTYRDLKTLSDTFPYTDGDVRIETMLVDGLLADASNPDADPIEGLFNLNIWELDSIILGYDT